MEIGKTLYVTKREKWRAWLSRNSSTASEIWLVYYRKASGRPRISYEDAVEEALCFGWIDSIAKSIDEDSWAQRFSPRRNSRNWSDINKRRARKLIREGRMTEAGLAKIDFARAATKPTPKPTPKR